MTTKTMNDDLWSYSYTDSGTVTINTTDSIITGDYGTTINVADCDSNLTLDDITIGFGDYNSDTLTVGKTKLKEEDIKDLLAIAGMIKDMSDGSGIKKLFNTHKAMQSLGDRNNANSESDQG